MTELDLNRDTVQSIIDKAHEFQAGLDVAFPDVTEAGDEEWANQVAASFAGDQFHTEFKALVEDL